MTRGDHNTITSESCVLVLSRFGVTERQIQVIVDSNIASDSDQCSSAIHFDNCAFREGVDRICGLWRRIAMEADRFSEQSLRSLGEILHSVQDFYVHSSWVEHFAGTGSIPLWDLSVNSLPSDICSGTWDEGNPKNCAAGVPSHDEMTKEHSDRARGSQLVNGVKLYELARKAALEASTQVLREFVVSLPSRRELVQR